MVVDDVDEVGVSLAPCEDHPILVVDPNAVLASTIALQGFESIRGRNTQVVEACGARVVPGKWMLVYQAAAQLETWTGAKAPIELMAAAFDAAGAPA